MRVLFAEPLPSELEELLERRRRMGVDHHDEVWEGVLHMPPDSSHGHGSVIAQLACIFRPLADRAGLDVIVGGNLGESKENYRVPDLALYRSTADVLWHPTAALAVEVRSPDDETYDKFPFYSAHGVDELLVVDPDEQTVRWFALGSDEYRPITHSALIDLGADELAAQITWPAGAA